jgi:hypothetical protein
MLNFYYQRWMADNPLSQPPAGLPAVEPEVVTQPAAAVPLPPAALGTIDDFETPTAWQAFADEAALTTLTCAPVSGKAKSGTASLQIEFDIAPSSWATCGLFFDQPRDWSAAENLAFDLMAGATRFNVDLYVGMDDARETYAYAAESLSVTAETWVPYEIRWEQFQRVSWEENAGTVFASPGQISGIAFGFNTDSGQALRGVILVDNLRLLSRAQAEANLEPGQPLSPAEEPVSSPGGLPCASSLTAPLALIGIVWAFQRRNRVR